MNNTMILRGGDSPAPATRLVLALLERIAGGMLEVRLPDGSRRLFGSGEHGVTLQVHDEAMFGQVLARGDIGLAEAYLDGHWDSPDVTGLLTLLTRNRDVLRKAVYGSWRNLLAARLRHWLNGNSRAGSKRNIMAHYDLGNDFYRLWLDPGMSYSAAIYRANDGGDLETAQRAKYRRILRRLQAGPGQSVLEIGCGWGGFAELAVAEGLQVTGLTLSPAQLEWARKRVPQADLRLQDYRDTSGQFDHIVSIEMFEAVGERVDVFVLAGHCRVDAVGYPTGQHQAAKRGGKVVNPHLDVADFGVSKMRVEDDRGQRRQNPRPRPHGVVRDVEPQRRKQ